MIVLSSVVAPGQGLAWEAEAGAAAEKIVTSNGTTYVYSVPYTYTGQSNIQMDRYSSNGTLLSRERILAPSSERPEQSWIALRGTTIYCISRVRSSNSFSAYVSKYSTVTQSWIGAEHLDAGAEMRVEDAAFGDTTYAIIGSANGQSFLQRRNLNTNAVEASPAFAVEARGNVTRRTADTYVASGMNLGNPGELVVVLLGLFVTTKTRLINELIGQAFELVISEDLNFAYSIGVDQVSLKSIVVPLDLTTTSWRTTLSYGGPASSVKAVAPLKGSNAAYVYGQSIVRVTPTALSIAQIPGPAFDFADLVADSSGHPVVVTGKGDGTNSVVRCQRLNSLNLLPMNELVHSLPFDPVVPTSLEIDATGSARMIQERTDLGFTPRRFLTKYEFAGLSISGPFTIGGSPATGTVTLDQPAPAGGATFLLYSNNAAAVVPTSVTIPAGQASANFTITTTAVATNVKPTINARYDGLNLQTNFDLAAPLIQSVNASPQVQYGGLAGTGTVTLTGPAPTGGKVVSLTSSNTSRVTVPASINVPAGQASASFAITRIPTLVNASSVISATTGAVTKTVFVAVNAPIFLTATLGQTTLKGGQSTTMTLTINAPAPSGYTVTLVSGAPSLVTLPSSFAIPQNATTVNVPVSTSAVTSTIAITLVAYRGPYVRVMSLTLTP